MGTTMVYAAGTTEVDWYEQFGGATTDVGHGLVAADGAVYTAGVVGNALPGEVHLGFGDGFIRKYAPNGAILWTDQFGTALDDRVAAVAANGTHVALVGSVDTALPGNTHQGSRDVFVRVYTHSGTLVLNKQFGTTALDEGLAVALSDNYVYIVGKTNGGLNGETNGGGTDAFITKYHIGGAHEWTRHIGTTGFDQGLGVYVNEPAVYMVGSTDGSLPGFSNVGSVDMFVRKFDVNGNVVWTDQFGTSGFDLIFGVAEQGGVLYVAGDAEGPLPGQGGFGSSDPFIRAYDASDGSENWTDQFGTAGFDEAFSVAVDSTGVYVGGFVEGALPGETYTGGFDAYIRKYDFTGAEYYTTQLGTSGDENVFGLDVLDGVLYVGGSVTAAWPGETHAGANDVYLLKVSQDTDGDNITDPVDTAVFTASDDFDNGVTFGSITARGDQVLSIKNDPNSADGILITADASGGTTSAEISECGIATSFLDAGDSLVVTCGSVTLDILTGSIVSVLIAEDGREAAVTLSAGNGLTFESVTGDVTAAPSNTEDVSVTAGNQTVTLTPGMTSVMPSDLPITIDAILLMPAAAAVGELVTLTAVATSPVDEVSTITGVYYRIDEGTQQTLSADDGAFDEESEAATAVLGSFASPGVHEVCVTATDSVQNGSESICTLLAVYDPNGGYVTGGGQITSPAGAYTADPSVVGTAHFGFIAEYEQGAQTPTGNTQFRFQAGDLKFKSTSYDWLVVAGAKAQYKGYGKINNSGNYRFMLTAIDGDLLGGGTAEDTFRMKIWDESTGSVLYDNKLGSPDTADPTTELLHGSIVIHDD